MTHACSSIRFAPLIAVLCVLVAAARPSLALEPDEILLITNKNAPDSQSLAQLYCQLRNVPTDQIVTLDLPAGEEMPFETYETNVVAPVRQFITDHKLRAKIKCLLTFYGVPFRIHDKQNTPADNLELAELKNVRTATVSELQAAVSQFESKAVGINPSFKPQAGDTVPALLAREQAAISGFSAGINPTGDLKQGYEAINQILAFVGTVGGEADIDSRFGANQRNDATKTDEQRQVWVTMHKNLLNARDEEQQLEATRWDPVARDKLRHLARAHFGLVGLWRVLDAQVNYLTTDATAAATDSELALLWWDYYPRQRWVQNPLNLAFNRRPSNVLMVMRLDGPDLTTVQHMMHTSVEVEKTGLDGIIAIDARGIAPIDEKGNLSAFGEFDETLRHLALIVRTKTKLKIAFDDQDIVFPPHFAKNVACYCGWYSVNHYIPGCDFNPGAVGYHIASYEMVTLHYPSPGWVRGLLTDGVVATLGPVAEPYLSAFPKPDEFFPLLFTGKLSLAEVYWKTTPFASWMISFIGDPLYSPYKLHPAMDAADLPPGLRKAFP